jgi:hypothetical protein
VDRELSDTEPVTSSMLRSLGLTPLMSRLPVCSLTMMSDAHTAALVTAMTPVPLVA